MDVAQYLMVQHEQTLRRRMDITANNIANMNSTGFLRERAEFSELLVGAGTPGLPGGDTSRFVIDRASRHDITAGPLTTTGNPLDVAPVENIFIALIDGAEDAAGEGAGVALTRAGALSLRGDGVLVAASGRVVAGRDGQPIRVPADARAALTIAADGTVNGPGGALGQIQLQRAEPAAVLTPLGDGAYRAASELAPAAGNWLTSGALIGSNVNAVAETTRMIDVLRRYQAGTQALSDLGELRGRTIDRLSRFN